MKKTIEIAISEYKVIIFAIIIIYFLFHSLIFYSVSFSSTKDNSYAKNIIEKIATESRDFSEDKMFIIEKISGFSISCRTFFTIFNEEEIDEIKKSSDFLFELSILYAETWGFSHRYRFENFSYYTAFNATIFGELYAVKPEKFRQACLKFAADFSPDRFAGANGLDQLVLSSEQWWEYLRSVVSSY